MKKFRPAFLELDKHAFPDWGALIPLGVIFASSMNGTSPQEAVQAAFHAFAGSAAALANWGIVIALNFAIFAYAKPVFMCHLAGASCSEPDAGLASKALKRLNGLFPFIVIAAIVLFVVGRWIGLALNDDGMQEVGAHDPGAGRFLFATLEAIINGLITGLMMALKFNNRLYKARETVVSLKPEGAIRYASLYSRIFMVLCAVLAFASYQVFMAAGNFYAFGSQRLEAPAKPLIELDVRGFPLTGPEIATTFGADESMKGLLGAIGLKFIVICLLGVQILLQIKRLIKYPLGTVHGRLKLLNSSDPGSAEAIEITQRDEFSEVYAEVNALIAKQRSQLVGASKRFEDVVESAADPIVAYDAEGVIRLFNPAAEASFGYGKDEVIGKDMNILFGCCVEGFEAARLGEARRFTWARPDGREIIFEPRFSESCWEESGAWTTVILRDVTRQAEFEAELTRAKAAAENASRMKGEFLANMSHELRTPLNAILGFTQLMQEDRNLTESQVERIGIIARSGEHLLALINDILDISKIESGKMELHPVAFDLHRFLGDLRDMFGLKCNKKGLTLYQEVLDGVPRFVRGDLAKLRQVMVNLLGNAVKFTDEGGIGILAGMESGRVKFSVRDTGRGIPEEEIKLVLEPFVQASTSDHEGGTGLGLAISRRYIEMMGGSLEIESELGKGSVFSFSIPLEEAEEADADEERDEELSSAQLEEGQEALALVVDDQEANRLVLKEILERAGFAVCVASDGREALATARELMPALIFMDIKMPVMDGYQAVAALRADPATAGLKIFALTASAFSHDEARIREAGFDGFLAKPFKRASLFRLIRDSGGIPLRFESAKRVVRGAGEGAAVEPDFGAARAALGADGTAALVEAMAINDFGAIAERAEALASAGGGAGAFGAALARAARDYDEDAARRLIESLEVAKEANE